MTLQEFQEEFKKLTSSLPVHPNHIDQCENSDYGNYLYKCKNVHYGFEDAECNDITYLYDSFQSNNCCDGDYVIMSQDCYDCVDAVSCNNCTYTNYCSRLYDSHFCKECSDCNNIFGCAYLQHKEYCIFNTQYTKEEYEKKVALLKKRPAEENLAELDRIDKSFPVTQTHTWNTENCDYGNQVFMSKNMYMCFDATQSLDCGYVYDSHNNKNCYDMTQSHHSAMCYEVVDGSDLNNCHHMNYCGTMYDSAYCNDCEHSHDLFGCIGLKNKEFCILNKQYTQDEYKKIVSEIMSINKIS